MITITRVFEWDAAHRVLGHENKCKYLHGHRYKAEVTVTSPELDGLGRVVDFGVVKQRLGSWIDHQWDHNLIIHSEDAYAKCGWGTLEALVGREPFIMPNGNPTAENIASCLYFKAKELLPDLQVVKVKVWETPNCWAEYSPE